MQPSDGEVTGLLAAFRHGDADAETRLMELTYRELRRIANAYLRREREAVSIQATEVVHEVYLRMLGQATATFQDRARFFQFAAHVMRQILVDRARKRNAGKRGGGAPQLALDEALNLAEESSGDILILDQALSRLKSIDARQHQIVEMRFFAGMSIEDIAGALNVTPRTVNRDWRMARAWLYQQIYG